MRKRFQTVSESAADQKVLETIESANVNWSSIVVMHPSDNSSNALVLLLLGLSGWSIYIKISINKFLL